MSGVLGGRVKASELRTATTNASRPGEQSWRYESGDAGIGVYFRGESTSGLTRWDDGSRGGVVYGAVTNRGELNLSDTALFDRLFDRPTDTAAALEGEFFIACYDANDDRFLLVSDKLGARPCYYVSPDEGSFQFGTSVSPLLAGVDDPTLDVQGASDMLLMGHMWGDHTLVREVDTMRPATVVDVTDGNLSAERYWKASYDEAPANEAYLSELADRYRQAIGRMSTTLPQEAGIWLSGGLDSRTTAAVLTEIAGMSGSAFSTLRAYTYDANPPTNDNPRIAREVANKLGVELGTVPLTAETFGDVFEDVIEAADGMIRWNTAVNLSATYGLDPVPPVMMEGMIGELIGDHLYRRHLSDYRSAVESQYHSESQASVETVSRLLDADVNPLTTFKEELSATPETDMRKQVLDIHFQNYYRRQGLTSDRITRQRTDTRNAYIDGDYLEWCSRLPKKFRKGGLSVGPGSEGVPYGTSRAKLELVRRIDPDLAEITYERTKVKPSLPYPVHVAGFLGNVIAGRLRSKPTYGSGQLADIWVRDESTALHRYVRNLVDDAASRPLFNGDAVRRLFDDHIDGENNAPMLAQITTLEYWIQSHLD